MRKKEKKFFVKQEQKFNEYSKTLINMIYLKSLTKFEKFKLSSIHRIYPYEKYLIKTFMNIACRLQNSFRQQLFKGVVQTAKFLLHFVSVVNGKFEVGKTCWILAMNNFLCD